jgi:hypothetical protein
VDGIGGPDPGAGSPERRSDLAPPPPIEEPEVERLPRREAPGRPPLPPGRRRVAFLLAMGVDLVQWIALPLFMWGAASPANDALDVAIALVMTRLIGFHWAFLPTFVAELMPIVDLVPTWTLAVWIATRGR